MSSEISTSSRSRSSCATCPRALRRSMIACTSSTSLSRARVAPPEGLDVRRRGRRTPARRCRARARGSAGRSDASSSSRNGLPDQAGRGGVDGQLGEQVEQVDLALVAPVGDHPPDLVLDRRGVAAHHVAAQRLVLQRLLALLGRGVEDDALAEDRRHERVRRGLVERRVRRPEELLVGLAHRDTARRPCRRAGTGRCRRTRRGPARSSSIGSTRSSARWPCGLSGTGVDPRGSRVARASADVELRDAHRLLQRCLGVDFDQVQVHAAGGADDGGDRVGDRGGLEEVRVPGAARSWTHRLSTNAGLVVVPVGAHLAPGRAGADDRGAHAGALELHLHRVRHALQAPLAGGVRRHERPRPHGDVGRDEHHVAAACARPCRARTRAPAGARPTRLRSSSRGEPLGLDLVDRAGPDARRRC